MTKTGVTKALRRDFELQSSELWGNKNNLSAQLKFQLIGFETKSDPFFLVTVSTLKNMFFQFFGVHLTTKWSWVKSQKWSGGPHAISFCDSAWPAKADYRFFCMTQSIPT